MDDSLISALSRRSSSVSPLDRHRSFLGGCCTNLSTYDEEKSKHDYDSHLKDSETETESGVPSGHILQDKNKSPKHRVASCRFALVFAHLAFPLFQTT